MFLPSDPRSVSGASCPHTTPAACDDHCCGHHLSDTAAVGTASPAGRPLWTRSQAARGQLTAASSGVHHRAAHPVEDGPVRISPTTRESVVHPAIRSGSSTLLASLPVAFHGHVRVQLPESGSSGN